MRLSLVQLNAVLLILAAMRTGTSSQKYRGLAGEESCGDDSRLLPVSKAKCRSRNAALGFAWESLRFPSTPMETHLAFPLDALKK